jgi:hypothetical protein
MAPALHVDGRLAHRPAFWAAHGITQPLGTKEELFTSGKGKVSLTIYAFELFVSKILSFHAAGPPFP